MSARAYRLGRRQPGVEATRSAILSAARRLIAEHGRNPASAAWPSWQVCRGSRCTTSSGPRGLVKALAAEASPEHAGPTHLGPETDPLRQRIAQACATWAVDPALFRQLHGHRDWVEEESSSDRALAESLAADDQLRPGCSIKEAEDVIGVLTSFPAFDRLHKGGRRTPSAVGEILMRLASVILR